MNITAKYLTKVFDGGVYALDGFSASIEHGSVVSVLGESGCGKTTLLRLLSGLEKPTAGELYFDGVLFKDVPIKQRDTAIVFQEYVLYPKMTVWENVAVALERYELPREEEERRVSEVLKELGIYKLKNQLPRVLSGGQQQRVALARAIVRDPSLLLFDEPLSNIAEEQRAEYIRLILKLKERLPRTTFVYVTHNPREAMSIGDHLLVMHNGKCLQFGSKERVWKYPYSVDVLRSICMETREINGTVENGVFKDYAPNGETYKFDTDYSGKATVVFNPYDDYAPCLFDENGNALCGEKHTVFLSGTFDGEPAVVKFGGTSFAADDDFEKRFIGTRGAVKVGIKSTAFKFTRTSGDLEIKAERTGDEFTVCGEKFCLFGGEKFDGHLYVDPADVELYDDNGKRTLAHYRIYSEPHTAHCSRGKFRIESGAIDRDCGSGNVDFVFNDSAKITLVKKGGLKAECLDEEDIGGERLVYMALKGYTHYVTFRAAPHERFFGVKKLRISVDPDGITLIDPRN